VNRTGIEWTDFTWNPVTGCLHNCDYCYARAVATRFPQHFPHGFEPWFYPERLAEPAREKRPSKIFVCSMADLFGSWVPNDWIEAVTNAARAAPQHTFQFLTKRPDRYHEWDGLPENAWYGTTVDSPAAISRIEELRSLDATTFVSFEPLTAPISPDLAHIGWAIVGGRSAANGLPAVVPDPAWIAVILDAAWDAGAAVYVKDNADPGGRSGWPRDYPAPASPTPP
jgi:protein gp37